MCVCVLACAETNFGTYRLAAPHTRQRMVRARKWWRDHRSAKYSHTHTLALHVYTHTHTHIRARRHCDASRDFCDLCTSSSAEVCVCGMDARECDSNDFMIGRLCENNIFIQLNLSLAESSFENGFTKYGKCVVE